MTPTLKEDWSDPEFVTVRVIWVAVALSLLVHLAALWEWLPRMRMVLGEGSPQREAEAPLSVQLAPPERSASVAAPPPRPTSPAPAAPTPQARRSARQPLQAPVVRQPAPSPPPMVATAPPPILTAPVSPQVVPEGPRLPEVPRPEPPKAATPPTETDLSAYIAARRRERGEGPPQQSAEERENARRDQVVAANLASINAAYGTGVQQHSGGIFSIVRLGDSDGEFTFYGWNSKIHGRLTQRIQVQRGSEPNVRTAMIRRMIAIIRQYEQEDFVWESRRLGREVTLSARAEDNGALETFLMAEFFDARGEPRADMPRAR